MVDITGPTTPDEKVPMTSGRTEWGHQHWEWVPKSHVATYKKRGWRRYDPDWENRSDFWNPFWWIEAIIRRLFG